MSDHELRDGDFRASDLALDGKTLTMTAHNYCSEFRFSMTQDGESVVCTINESGARALQKALNSCVGSLRPTRKEIASNLTDRMIAITELIGTDPDKSNALAMVSFVAGYFGFKIAP